MEINHVVTLNNFLQAHPSGNLVSNLSWTVTQEGPNNQATHTATLMFRGVIVGRGSGTSKSRAKEAAAVQAVQYFREIGVPE